MVILNSFDRTQIEEIAPRIHQIILQEPRLTRRSLDYLKKLLLASSVYVLFDDNKKIVGFVIKENLSGNFFEIKSWYVVPEERGRGLAEKLLIRSTENEGDKYIGATFQPDIAGKVEKYGFIPVPLFRLPIKVVLVYVFSRPWSSILRHLFKKRGILLLKQ